MDPPPPGRGEFDTLELVINVDKSVLFYSTIYILFRVEACSVGSREGGDYQQGESEAVSANALIVLDAYLKCVNGRLAERGWTPVDASCPSISIERRFLI